MPAQTAPAEPDTAASDAQLSEIGRRLARLEKKPKDIWEKLQAVSGLLSGVLVAVVGFFLTNTVNRAVQDRQMQFSSAKDMQELLGRLTDPSKTPQDKETTALIVANWGKFALQPLINQLQGELNTSLAAEAGLHAIARSDPASTCAAMVAVLDNRTRLFPWPTHLAAIRVLADCSCPRAIPALERYRSLLNSRAEWERRVRPDPSPTPENIDRLRQETENALQAMGRG